MMGRVGSSYLIDLLDSHPDIRAKGERIGIIRRQGGSEQDQIQWIKAYLKAPIIGKNKAIGFKTKLADVIDPTQFAEELQSLGARIIIMQRRNVVKQAISSINSEKLFAEKKAWNITKGQDKQKKTVIEPDRFAQKLETILSRRDELNEFTASLDLPQYQIYYEDLFGDDSEQILQELFAFLEVSSKPTASNIVKFSSDDLREIVENFEELRAPYQNTEYNPMFDEVIFA